MTESSKQTLARQCYGSVTTWSDFRPFFSDGAGAWGAITHQGGRDHTERQHGRATFAPRARYYANVPLPDPRWRLAQNTHTYLHGFEAD